MPPKDDVKPTVQPTESAHIGLALAARKLADTEGITVAAAVEKLTKKAAAKDVG